MMSAYIPCERCDFRPGDHIDGQYRVEKPLGEGTFGQVFRVSGNEGKIYALKLLKLWTVESGERARLLKRFDLEYETGQIASHYLVHSCGKGMVGGNPYILMEYCPGGDLLQAAEEQRVDFAKAASEVLGGLRDLHRHGKVHRDLKPENVLMRQDGTAVLTDFGISGDQNKRMTERGILGTPKQIFGTYGYMPPEQINPKRGDATVLPTTDIFSFGVMMYQLLTCEMPFGRLQSEADLPAYVLNGKNGRWDRTLLQKTPEGDKWLPLMEGCLEPDFRKRLQNVEAVLPLVPPAGNGRKIKLQPQHPAPEETDICRVRNGLMLRVMQGEEYGRTYRLEELTAGGRRMLTMGRDTQTVRNDIPIREEESAYISRKHCTLEYDQGSNLWIIRDGQWDRSATNGWKASLNGTYVNSAEVSMAGMPLKPGDIVSIGDVKLRVEGY